MTTIIQRVFFFFDDSGVFHLKEQSGYFVYAGYVFTSRNELENAKRKYINANKSIKRECRLEGELKAAVLEPKHKRALFTVIKEFDSVSCAVRLRDIYPSIMSSKKAICRYKDYIIKRCVKQKIESLIQDGRINANEDIELIINIDQQLTATNGYYDLRDSIQEELQHGIQNFDYAVFHKPLFNSNVTVKIKYCESKNDYLIQASDILANRIWTGFRINKPELLGIIPNHTHLSFP